MRVSEIADRCGYEYCGEDLEVDSLRFAVCAGHNSIAIAQPADCIGEIEAQCILIQPALINTDKTIIFAGDSIEYAAVKIARLLQAEKGIRSRSVKYQQHDHYFIGEHTVIGKNTYVGPNACIDDDVIIGDDCFIAPNVHIGTGTIIHNGVRIGSGSFVGSDSFYHYYDDGLQEFEGLGVTMIREGVSIGNNTTIQRGTFSDTIIGARSKIGNLIDIGHDVCIGHDCKIVSQTGIASNVKVGNYVTIYGQVGVANHVTIGDKAVVYAKSLVTKNVNAGKHVSGMYARDHIEELRMQAKLKKRGG